MCYNMCRQSENGSCGDETKKRRQKIERKEAKLAFFIDKKSRKGCNGHKLPREITAVFVDSGNYHMKDCYAHEGQHGTCAVDWIAEECRPATYAEYKALYDELDGMVGYDIEVVDAEWWLDHAMRFFKLARLYYTGGENGKVA